MKAEKMGQEPAFTNDNDILFNIDSNKDELPKMTISDFVSKTRLILSKINEEYASANQWRRVEDYEYEKQDCDNCMGECTIIKNGIELHCVPDKLEGDCFVLEFAHESFVEEIEQILLHDDKYSFYDLLSCNIIADEMLKQENE